MSFFTRIIFLAILPRILLAQPSPPALGIQLSNRTDLDIRFPLTVTQCEAVFIFFNTTGITDDSRGAVGLRAAEFTPVLIIGYFPLIRGVGYFEWICNIPAGYGFWVEGTAVDYPSVVKPGSLSACLHSVTTLYPYATYPPYFATYTASPPRSFAPLPDRYLLATSTVPFPAGSFATYTVNPELIVATPTTTPPPHVTSTSTSSQSAPSHVTSSTASTSSRKSSTPAIAGGVVGGIILAIVLGAIFFRLRKRQTRSFNAVDLPIASSPPTAYARWAATSQSGPVSALSTGMPVMSGSNPPVLHSNPRPGDAHLPTEQAGGPLLLATIPFSTAPTPDPQTIRLQHPQITSQTHVSMYPQLDPPRESDSSVRGRGEEASLHSAGARVPTRASRAQPAASS